jgi:hypothetical protein
MSTHKVARTYTPFHSLAELAPRHGGGLKQQLAHSRGIGSSLLNFKTYEGLLQGILVLTLFKKISLGHWATKCFWASNKI